MSNEKFRIDIETINLEKAVRGSQQLADNMANIVKQMQGVDAGDKKLASFEAEIKRLSGVMKASSSVIRDAESANRELFKTQTELSRGAKMEADAENARARAVKTSAQADTESIRTGREKIKLQIDAINLANKQQAAEARAAREALKGGAYSRLTKDLSAYTTKLKDALAAGNVHGTALNMMAEKYKRLQGAVTDVNGKFVELTGATKNTDTVTQMLSRTFASFIGNLMANGLQNAIQNMVQFGKEISNAGVALDALKNTMMAATGGWNAGGREIKWLLGMSNQLGVAFGDVSDSYAKFMTSFTRSGGTMAQSRQIFSDISTAMVSLHLPAERMQGVFIALEQMANKGTVQAEELKRQLGNALPGAFELAAESMGILPAKLMDLMKKGQVVSKDFLPKFAQTVKDVLGQSIGIAVDQFNAHMARLATSTSLLKMELGQGLNAALLPFVKLLVGATNGLGNLARYFNENSAAAAALKAILIPLGIAFGALAFSIGSATASFISAQLAGSAFFIAMSAGSKKLIADAIALNASLGGLPLIIGLVATAVAGLGFYLADTSKKAADVSAYIGMRGQIVELTKSVTSLDLSTKEGQASLLDYKKEFPELTNYLVATGKEFKNLSNDELKHISILGTHDAKMRAMGERTAELASWQNTLSAVWGVAWDNIQKWSKIAGQNILISFKWIIDGIKLLVNTLGTQITNVAKGLGSLGQLASSAGSKLGIVGAPLKAWGGQVSAVSDGILTFGETMTKEGSKIDTIGIKIKTWGANTAFGVDVTNKKLEIANTNALKKLQEINKGAHGTVKALQQAQAATKGLTGTDGGDSSKKSKSGQNDTAWDKFNKEISALEELIKIRKLNGQSIDDLVPKYIKLKAQQDEINKSVQNLTGDGKSGWDLFGKEISALEEQIRVRKLSGQSIDDLVPKYVRLKKQQDDINKSMQDLVKPTNEMVTGWAKLEKQLKESEDTYKFMLANSQSFSEAEINQQRALMQGYKINVQYNKTLEDSADLMGMTSRTANQLTDNLVDNLFTKLGEGETIWSRFKDSGIAAMKALATEWIKSQMKISSEGFQAGWKAVGLGEKSASFSDKLIGGVTGMMQGAKKMPLEGTLNNPTFLTGKIGSSQINDTTSAIKGLTSASAELSSTAQTQLSSSMTQTASSISSVANPAITAAGSISQIGVSAPMAAMGSGALAMGMTVMAPAAKMAAPALEKMATSLGSIAEKAASAAVSMSALAVATAANSVAGIPIAGAVLAPIAALATGTAIAVGSALAGAGIAVGSTMAGAGNLLGGGLTGLGNKASGASSIIKHARGGVVSSPTTFPMQGGNIGVAGEAGTEVIAPAVRMANGDVGVGAVAPVVNINNYTNAAVEVIKRPNNEVDIKITELNSMLSSSRTNKGMTAAQSRMKRSGRQVG